MANFAFRFTAGALMTGTHARTYYNTYTTPVTTVSTVINRPRARGACFFGRRRARPTAHARCDRTHENQTGRPAHNPQGSIADVRVVADRPEERITDA